MSDDDQARPPWMRSEMPDGDAPDWDQEEADALVSLLVVAGFTRLAADGTTVKSQDRIVTEPSKS